MHPSTSFLPLSVWHQEPGRIAVAGDGIACRLQRIKAQVRRIGTNVTVDGLHSFMTDLEDGGVGLFVRTSGLRITTRLQATRKQQRVTEDESSITRQKSSS